MKIFLISLLALMIHANPSYAIEPLGNILCKKDATIPLEEKGSGPLGTHWNVFEMTCTLTISKTYPLKAGDKILMGIEAGKKHKLLKSVDAGTIMTLRTIDFVIPQQILETIPIKKQLKAPGGGRLEAYELAIYAAITTDKVILPLVLSYGE